MQFCAFEPSCPIRSSRHRENRRLSGDIHVCVRRSMAQPRFSGTLIRRAIAFRRSVQLDRLRLARLKGFDAETVLAGQHRQTLQHDFHRGLFSAERDRHDIAAGHFEDVGQRLVAFHADHVRQKHPTLAAQRVQQRAVVEEQLVELRDRAESCGRCPAPARSDRRRGASAAGSRRPGLC